jgi:hypothetical protein
MRAAAIVLGVLAVTAGVSLFGFFGIVTPIATAALLLIPITFTLSVLVGFASRRRTWFG